MRQKGNGIFYFCLLVLVIYLCPYYIFGKDSIIRIQDNLDGFHMMKVFLSENLIQYKVGFHDQIENIMNGLPLFCLPGFEFSVLIYMLFTPFWAYVVNYSIVHAIGFCGMYFLSLKYLAPNDVKIASLVALTFSLLPVFTVYGISVLGIPLVAYSAISFIRNEGRLVHYVLLIVYCFYSILFLSGVFVLISLGLVFIYYFVVNKKINVQLLLAILVMISCYLLIEYKIIYSTIFNESFVSSRTLRDEMTLINFNGFLGLTIRLALLGQYHSSMLPGFFLLIPSFFALYYSYRKERWESYKKILALLSILFLIALLYELFHWEASSFIREFKLVKIFNFQRIIFLQPFIYFVLLAISLKVLFEHKVTNKIVIPYFIVLAIGIVMLNISFSHQGDTWSLFSMKLKKGISYKDFYSEDLMKEIKGVVEKDIITNDMGGNPKILCVGIIPSVCQNAGFYTLGDYQNNYPVEYYYEFSKILTEVSNVDVTHNNQFNNTLARCYIQVRPEFEVKIKNGYIPEASINIDQAEKMGAEYLLSKYELGNAKELNLDYMEKFGNESTYYIIHLYKIL